MIFLWLSFFKRGLKMSKQIPKILDKGYRPIYGTIDVSRPPKGGSGVPPKLPIFQPINFTSNGVVDESRQHGSINNEK
jgi:hypothetical protein